MKAGTVSDFIFERLSESGVGRIYGYSGDGINGLAAGRGGQAAGISPLIRGMVRIVGSQGDRGDLRDFFFSLNSLISL